jgi:hypothetical protein
MSVYLLHFHPSYLHAGHYIVSAKVIPRRRLQQHLAGRGSPLVKAAIAAGSRVHVAHFFPGAPRSFERKLKNWGSAKKWCLACGIGSRPVPVCIE